ncbi:APC family permease [Eubacteriales bacterium KG127]
MENNASTKDLRRELGKKELIGIAGGQVIGSGIMVLVGLGIGMTGRSVSLAFVIASLFVVVLSIPSLFIMSTVRLRGGEYTQGYMLIGPRFAGFWTLVFTFRNIALSVYVVSFADYVISLFPDLNHKLISIAIATIFFGINIFPTKYMARIQNVLFYILLIALGVFVCVGLPNVKADYFVKDFFTGGIGGFFEASAFLTFAVMGANGIFQMGGECKNPKKDIPFAFLVATLGISILYALVGVVASGVLNVNEVANLNLAKVASEILPRPLYLFFIIGGAWGALATTLNANIAWVTKPLIQASEDGWFPRWLAKLHPKYKTPIYLLGLFYIITIIPILIGITLQSLANLVLIMAYVVMIFTSIATIRIPKILPDEWEKSPYKCNKILLVVLCVASAIVLMVQIYFNFASLNKSLIIGQIVFLVVAYLYAELRYRSGKVKMHISYEDD